MEEDPKVGHQPLTESAGLQFGRLSNEDTLRCVHEDRCDGQLGHIVLPMSVYHPFHVAFTQQILSKIYIICYKLTLKKKVHSYSFQLLVTS
ncbi:unnamed protein product [Sphagnum tenellum]